MKRILFLQPTIIVGGAERILFDLIRELNKDRYHIQVACCYAAGVMGERIRTLGVPVKEHLFNGRLDPLGPLKLIHLCQTQRIDLIYTFEHPLTMFWSGIVASLTGAATIVGVHSTGGNATDKRRLVGKFVRFDQVLALSHTHKKYLIEIESFPAASVAVLSSGIDPTPYLRERVPSSHVGLPDGVPLVGIVAMLRREKAHDVFIEAARDLCEWTNAHFVIVGDGPERDHVEQLCKDTGYADRFHVLGRRDDVPTILRALHVAVLSSHDVIETLPIALMEAMAAGLPVVSTRVGSVHELVLDGETGLLVPPNRPAELAAAIGQLLTNPARAKLLGAAGRDRVLHHFTLDQMVRATEKAIDDLVRLPAA